MNAEVKLDDFKTNLFIPLEHLVSSIPDGPGNYLICLNEESNLPNLGFDIDFKIFEGKGIIYTGIASVSLRERDCKQHFVGNNAGRSTLRLSLGCLLGYNRIHRDKKIVKKKFKFNADDEMKLSRWMRENLVMYYLPNSDYSQLECQLINQLNPPLNLKGNKNLKNRDFRNKLSSLRTAPLLKETNLGEYKEERKTKPESLKLKKAIGVFAFIYVLFRLLEMIFM